MAGATVAVATALAGMAMQVQTFQNDPMKQRYIPTVMWAVTLDGKTNGVSLRGMQPVLPFYVGGRRHLVSGLTAGFSK